jgi:hypothetical protein
VNQEYGGQGRYSIPMSEPIFIGQILPYMRRFTPIDTPWMYCKALAS